ncbi:MAG: SDR family oxidoreductase [Anaerolineales bacterium]|nr:SDR family oxidoreductase [Anaerolineales bacterium]
MQGNLKEKWALVTGASSGLGVDFARRLAERGCNLILVARREERLAEVREEIESEYGVEARVMAMDLARDEAPRELLDEVDKEGLPVDVLINNAGFGMHGPFEEGDWERYRTMIKLNVQTLVGLTRLVLDGMRERGFGYIMLVASNGAFQPTPEYALYGATKSLVRSFGEALSYELRNSPVSCTVVSPGPTRTEFHDVAGQDRQGNLYIRLAMMESEHVAEIGVRSMLREKPSVVPGLLNKVFAWTAQRGPRRLIIALAGWLMGG